MFNSLRNELTSKVACKVDSSSILRVRAPVESIPWLYKLLFRSISEENECPDKSDMTMQIYSIYCNLYKKYTLPQSKSSHLFDEGDIYVKESKTSYQWVQRWE